ncbi:MAG: hypothetical protein ACYC8V_09770, partial [Caulobacteraceae bacterium]
MSPRPPIAAAALASLVLVGAARADNETAATRAAAGSWRLSEVGGKIGCTLDLSDQATDPTKQGALAAKAPF